MSSKFAAITAQHFEHAALMQSTVTTRQPEHSELQSVVRACVLVCVHVFGRLCTRARQTQTNTDADTQTNRQTDNDTDRGKDLRRRTYDGKLARDEADNAQRTKRPTPQPGAGKRRPKEGAKRGRGTTSTRKIKSRKKTEGAKRELGSTACSATTINFQDFPGNL